MRNERRDQSGIVAAVLPVPPSTAARDRSMSQPRTHRPTPTEIADATATMPGSASGSPREAANPTIPTTTKATAAIA
jgi:hypothetical protein